MNFRKNTRRCLLVLFAWLAAGHPPAFATDAADSVTARTTPYVLAVVPRQSQVLLHRQWSPFAQALTRELGREVRLVISASFAEFETLLNRGQADLAYMNPYHAVVFRQRAGYRPLVRDGSRQLSGVMVVRDDHPAKKLSDLPKPARIAFPDPNAFVASLYMRAILDEREKLPYRPSYVGTHANVLRHVLYGRVDAGGTAAHTLDHEQPEVRARLRVLYRTPPFSPHPISVHSRMTKPEQEAILAAVQRLAAHPEGRKVMADINMRDPVAAQYERDYQPLETLKLERYYRTDRRP